MSNLEDVVDKSIAFINPQTVALPYADTNYP
jgi:hypothetical protein